MWQATKRNRERLARERVVVGASRGGALRVCVVYPNSYRVGMSNLGYQAVLGIFQDSPGITCDRAFVPEPDLRQGRGDLRSVELGCPLGDFDIVALSISFETDYLNVVRILRGAGVAPLASDRGDLGPLIIGGGPAIFLNPEPIADFFDLLLVGEAEEMLPEFIESFLAAWGKRKSKQQLLDDLDQLEGAYRPGAYQLQFHHDVDIAVAKPLGRCPARVKRRYLSKLDRFPTFSRIMPAESVFDDMFLIEASRGCQWGCRFCAAGYIYRPVRYRTYESLAGLARMGLEHASTIGLVGAELGSLPGLTRLCELVGERGGRLSPSSLRADTVSDDLANGLQQGATRTVTIAPEAGSERLRRVINKNLAEEALLDAASRLGRCGVRTLRLYFMIGLPTEEEEDVSAIAQLAGKIRRRFVAGAPGARIRLSVSPFVPKPWTPFQWDGLEELSSLKRKVALLRREAGALGGIMVEAGSPREAYYQALLSRGDRRLSSLLLAIYHAQGQWWPVIQKLRKSGGDEIPDLDGVVHRTYSQLDPLPWEIIDQGLSRRFLWRERQRALASSETPSCDVLACRVCGIC